MTDMTTVENGRNRGVSSDVIKYFAIAAMLIDHIAWCFVDTYSVWGYIMHVIGRLTAPIMTYFIVEGFHYTRNLNRYMLRLGIFALISWIPFIYMEAGTLPISFDEGNLYFNPMQGVIFTFFLTVTALRVNHSEKMSGFAKGVVITFLCIVSMIGDWFCFPIIWALLFDKYRGGFKKQAIAFEISSVIMVTLLCLPMGGLLQNSFQYGVMLAVIPLYFYNGEKGRGGKFNKWFFYVFYPAHMLILGVLKWVVL